MNVKVNEFHVRRRDYNHYRQLNLFLKGDNLLCTPTTVGLNKKPPCMRKEVCYQRVKLENPGLYLGSKDSGNSQFLSLPIDNDGYLIAFAVLEK